MPAFVYNECLYSHKACEDKKPEKQMQRIKWHLFAPCKCYCKCHSGEVVSSEKKYVLSVDIYEGPQVIYSKRSREVTASSRLEAVQFLQEENKEIMRKMLETFHIVNEIASKRLNEKGNN